MPDPTSPIPIDISALSKPANTLIKKVSTLVGAIGEPYQIKRIAKANASAALIEAQSKVEAQSIEQRAIQRLQIEEIRHQQNIEAITAQALPQLISGADPMEMNDDWITNFFDKSRTVSDQQMQSLWARVLAGEANKPGTFSRRTINTLQDIDKRDASIFARVCKFVGSVGGFVLPLILNHEDEIYARNGISFTDLSHLRSTGLVQFEPLAGFTLQHLPRHVILFFNTSLWWLEMPKERDNKLTVGNVMFTDVVRQLYPIAANGHAEGLMEYLMTQWKEYAPSGKEIPAALRQMRVEVHQRPV